MNYLNNKEYAKELYHHGILGMKWGKRNGPPYPLDEKDHSASEKKAGWRKSLEEKRKKTRKDNTANRSKSDKKTFIEKHKDKLIEQYIGKGYGPAAAKNMAEGRMRTEAIIAVAGTVALTAASVAIYRRVGQDYFDKTFKSGEVIQNIGAYKDANFNDTPFFAAVNKSDKKLYEMNYPFEKREMAKLKDGYNYEGIYNNQIKINEDVKRASVTNARKIFYEKMNKDPQFKKDVLDTLTKTYYYDPEAVYDYLINGKKSKKLYDRFNQALATPEFQTAGIHKKYYDEMKKHGYNAILDINDTRYSGYKGRAKDPTIFFGNDKWNKISNKKLSDVEIDKNIMKVVFGKLAKADLKYLAIGVGIKEITDDARVKKYLDEHPNSELSRKEILKVVKGSKNI